jgi:hypothetical protein
MSLTLQTLRYYPSAQIRQGADRVKSPDPPRLAGRDLPRRTRGDGARHDQLTNASGLSSVRCPPIHREIKKAPGLLPGLRDDCLGGNLSVQTAMGCAWV